MGTAEYHKEGRTRIAAVRIFALRLGFAIFLIVLCEPWNFGWDNGIPPWVTEQTKLAGEKLATKQTEPKEEDLPEPVLITMEKIKGVSDKFAAKLTDNTENLAEARAARQPLLDILRRAGLAVDDDVMRLLPKWSQVVELYGDKPVIFGQDTCKQFRDSVPKPRRFVGVAGQFNTGTNALFNYMNDNMEIPENEMFHGVLWTIPWYKHAWVSLRYRYMYRLPDEHSNVFPVIMIRDPYFWMKSMCESPYTVEWNQSPNHCPNLIEESTIMNADVNSRNRDIPPSMGETIAIKWGRWNRRFPSIAHAWSLWYHEYVQARFPRMIVRFEDLIFHTEDVVRAIQECVGAEMKGSRIHYPTAPAKTAAYFNSFKAQSGFVAALIKYGQDTDGRRYSNMTSSDLEYASSYLNNELMGLFHYKHPNP